MTWQPPTLHPFGIITQCPKCGGAGLTRSYRAHFTVEVLYTIDAEIRDEARGPEHIVVHCPQCGYELFERPRDASVIA